MDQLTAITHTAASLARQLDERAVAQIIDHCELAAEIIAREGARCDGNALRNADILAEAFGSAARHLREIRLLAARYNHGGTS